jgi:ankyrin repeat protein
MEDHRLDTAALLFEYGCDTEQTDQEGWTLLHHAVWNIADPQYIRVLIEHGANVHARTHTGETPLSLAVEHGPEEVERLIREYVSRR